MRVAARADNPLEFVGMLGGMAPAPLFEAYFGLMAARTIMAGAKLGVFAALAESPDDAEGLAKRLGGDRDGLDVLLVALHSMRYLDQAGDGTYTPSKIATRHLVPDASKPLAEVTGSFAYDMWDAFSRLETAIETGEPIGLHEDDPDDPYWGRYMRALFELAELRSADLCRLIKTDRPRRLLDLAGGHGGYSVAMCRRHADLTAKWSSSMALPESGARSSPRRVSASGSRTRSATCSTSLRPGPTTWRWRTRSSITSKAIATSSCSALPEQRCAPAARWP